MRQLALVMFAVLSCTLTGCTRSLWQSATQDRLFMHVDGYATDAAGTPTAVAVEYHGLLWFSSYRSFDLQPDGRPALPFGYATTRPAVFADAAADVPVEQYAAVAGYRFSDAEKQRTRELRRSSQYATLSSQHGYNLAKSPREDVELVELTPRGNPAAWSDQHGQKPLPANTPLLLVPRFQPRSAGDKVASCTIAVLLTPVTLIADVIVVPAVFISESLRGG
jgi:hypothetical protein